MNIRANKRNKKFLTIVFTLIFAASVFTVTAFATASDPSQADLAATPQISSAAPEGVSSQPDSGTSSLPEDVSSTPVTPESEGQSSIAASSQAPSETSSLSPASSEKGTASSRRPSEVTSHVVIDTQTSRVEAIASQAEQAVSDPDVLSSQNWNELLTSSALTSGQAATVSDAASESTSSQASQSGGVSWLLILGIVLILLALCGIAFFVYQQFFLDHNSHHPIGGGPIDISSNSDGDSDLTDSEPTEFTDISSDSDGTQHRDDYVPESGKSFDSIRPAGTVARTPAADVQKPVKVKDPVVNATEITAPIPQEGLPKSQATPVQGDKNFDWEAFFNDENK
jgi:hypothetical protein